jgi:hypothetical protein
VVDGHGGRGGVTYPTWRIWVCRCPGVVWAERPRHVTCTWCGRRITQIDVAQAWPNHRSVYEVETARAALDEDAP